MATLDPVAEIPICCFAWLMGVSNDMREGVKLLVALPIALLAVVVLGPVALIAALMDGKVTASDVAEVLRLCIDGADNAVDEYDTLFSRDFSDPRLQEVRADFLALANIDWQTPQARASFQALLTKVEQLQTNG
jgi:hypothetical protein